MQRCIPQLSNQYDDVWPQLGELPHEGTAGELRNIFVLF